jgi:hypothetical protein
MPWGKKIETEEGSEDQLGGSGASTLALGLLVAGLVCDVLPHHCHDSSSSWSHSEEEVEHVANLEDTQNIYGITKASQ